jgi:hypothetical protein
MLMVWPSNRVWQEGWKPPFLRVLAALSPTPLHGVWILTPLAHECQLVEDQSFGRGRRAIGPCIAAWAFQSLHQDNPQANSVTAWVPRPSRPQSSPVRCSGKNVPDPRLLVQAVIASALAGGSAQSMLRYTLAAPSLSRDRHVGQEPRLRPDLVTAQHPLERLETILSSYDFWVG